MNCTHLNYKLKWSTFLRFKCACEVETLAGQTVQTLHSLVCAVKTEGKNVSVWGPLAAVSTDHLVTWWSCHYCVEVSRSSYWWQPCRWSGPGCRIGIPLRTCVWTSDKRGPLSGCRDWGKQSHAVDRVRMFPIRHISETNRVVDGLVCVAVRFLVPVRRSKVTDDCSTGLDPVTMKNRNLVSGSVLPVNVECYSGLALHAAEHKLHFHSVGPIVLASTKLVSSNSTVLLGPPIFWEQPSPYSNIVSIEMGTMFDGCRAREFGQ